MKIAVLGAGSWGTALAALLCNKGHQVTLQSWQQSQVDAMARDRENKEFLPGVELPADLRLTADLAVAGQAELVVFAVPTMVMSGVAQQAQPFIRPETLLVNVAKGFVPDNGSYIRMSQRLQALFPHNAVHVLSGPSHAEEVGRGMNTTVCVAGGTPETCHKLQDAFITDFFRVYRNDDLIGVEVGGAVKNVIALGAGVVAGLGGGDNAKAALITRGLAEISRLGKALGAQPLTFSGLAGVGDLIVTCNSMHSRNYRAGLAIGQGQPWKDVVEHMGMVVEGVYATESAWALAQEHQVDMPITEQMYNLLYHEKRPADAVRELMTRGPKSEHA